MLDFTMARNNGRGVQLLEGLQRRWPLLQVGSAPERDRVHYKVPCRHNALLGQIDHEVAQCVAFAQESDLNGPLTAMEDKAVGNGCCWQGSFRGFRVSNPELKVGLRYFKMLAAPSS